MDVERCTLRLDCDRDGDVTRSVDEYNPLLTRGNNKGTDRADGERGIFDLPLSQKGRGEKLAW